MMSNYQLDNSAFTRLRIGQGLDVHPFVTGRACILGGVTIPYSHGLAGHSDADALTHAVIDALMGAAGQPDIGMLFPNHDAKWKDASSLTLLAEAWNPLRNQGYSILSIDTCLLAEAPKIAPYVSAMKTKLADALQIDARKIGIKATTTEQLGFVGRKEGILASAVALILTPDSITQ